MYMYAQTVRFERGKQFRVYMYTYVYIYTYEYTYKYVCKHAPFPAWQAVP